MSSSSSSSPPPPAGTVLFLCTGNYYRSRFADILFNHLARQQGLAWSACSRGLKTDWPGNKGALSEHTERRLAEMQINSDDASRMPIECCEGDLSEADLVIALKEAEHRAMLAKRFCGWEDRVTYWHVHDLDEGPPEVALAEIEELVSELIEQLKAKIAT